MEGYIYFVRNIHRPGEIKIGRSVNGAESRIRSWNTGSPGAFKLIKQVHVDDCVFAESELHRRFKNQRTDGEFFRVGWLQAAAMLSRITRVEQEKPALSKIYQPREEVSTAEAIFGWFAIISFTLIVLERFGVFL